MEQTKGMIGIEPSKVKIIYSDEVIEILNDVWIKKKLKIAHELRANEGLKSLSNTALMEYVLKLYIDKKFRKQEKKRLKSGDKNGMA